MVNYSAETDDLDGGKGGSNDNWKSESSLRGSPQDPGDDTAERKLSLHDKVKYNSFAEV